MRKYEKTMLTVLGALTISLCLALPSEARPPRANPDPGITDPRNPRRAMRSPAPVTVDRVIHDYGNIATTVDNFGLIGYWDYYGYPSGEWPRGSGRNYLAEVNYWMGAVTDEGDTLVATTWDDFQAIPALGTALEYGIMLSTDTTRYYNYDPTDTVGAGVGNPAKGWRVWNSEDDEWDYAQNYNSLDSTYFDGGPVSGQQSQYRFDDAASGQSLLGLQCTHTVLQWNYCYNKDFMFVILEITNTSAQDYHNFAFGLYVDLDIGGLNSGRYDDLVGWDSTENLAWIYDQDGTDEDWGNHVNTGVMGTKYVETPDGIGMTAMRSGDWDSLPTTDGGQFDLVNSARFDESTDPYDQYYIQCTRGIDLEAGKTVRVVYALVAGADEADFRANATMAQQLYDNNFVGPEPPAMPTLTAVPGDEKVYLYWNDAAQTGFDPLTGINDFKGYKLYRSDDHGQTWGGPISHDSAYTSPCMDIDYKPLAAYAAANPTDPIPRVYIDTNVTNGVEYWYCLTAYDDGDVTNGVDILVTGFGSPASSRNTVAVKPRTDPAGQFKAAGTVEHVYSGAAEPSAGACYPTVYDQSQVLGADYAVTFEDTPERTYWHLVNVTTGDTVLKSQTDYYTDSSQYPVVEGLQVAMRNAPDRLPRSMQQTAVANGGDTTLYLDPEWFFGSSPDAWPAYFEGGISGDQHLRATYEFRCTGENTLASAFNDNVGMGMAWSVPFEVWNTATNERVALAVYDFGLDGTWDSWDLVIVVNYPYDPDTDPFTVAWPYYFSWVFGFQADVFSPSVGDVFTIQGPLLNSPDDQFTFKADGINDARARAEMANIRVVPDPYYGRAGTGWETAQGERVIQFQNLPDQCTVRIYTLTGDLVRTLEHDGSDGGTEPWNLLSEGQRLVASGIYIYHVESAYGNRLGRFAILE
jgi:hypothetical protein